MKLGSLFFALFLFTLPLSLDASPPDKWIKYNAVISKLRDEKLKEAKGWIEKANLTVIEAEKTAGPSKISLLKEVGHYIQQAIGCHGAVLHKIETTGDKKYQDSIASLWSEVHGVILDYQGKIRTLEENIHLLEAEEEASTLLKQSQEKEKAASELVLRSEFPTHLKEVDSTISDLEQAKILYQEAGVGFAQVYTLLDRYYPTEQKGPFRQSALRCEKQSSECAKKQAEWSVHKTSQVKALKEQLTHLKGQPSLMLPIVRELFDAGVGDEKTLIGLLQEVASSKTVSKPFQETKMEDIPFPMREKKRRDSFFNHLPLLTKNCRQATTLHQLLTKEAPYVVALDQTPPRAEKFSPFLLQTTNAPFFTLKIEDKENILFQEEIPLPFPGSTQWETYLSEEGMVSTLQSGIKGPYQVDLRITSLLDGAYLLQIKTHSPFVLSLLYEDQLLYSTQFLQPLPWQLDALFKSAPMASRQVQSSDPIVYHSPISYVKMTRGDELSFHPVLDQFVNGLKGDPIALAQYVQNEIELVDPLNRRDEKGVFQATPLHKSAFGTFLEGEGGPWEQCALLIYLLRAAGFTALYGQGELALPTDDVERLFFTQLEGQEKTLLNYPFVLLKQEKGWMYLFPWMKDIQVKEGFDLYSLMPAEYASANRWLKKYLSSDPSIFKHVGDDQNGTAAHLFIKCVEEELAKQGLTLDDVGTHRSTLKRNITCWKDFPQCEVEQFEVSENLSPSLMAHLEIEIGSVEQPEKKIKEGWSLPALNGEALSIFFEPTDRGHDLVLQLQNERGQTVSHQTLSLDQTDQILQLKVTYRAGEVEHVKQLTCVKGTQSAVCFCFGNGSQKMTSFFAERYLKKGAGRDSIHPFLAWMGAKYFEQCSRAERKLAALHKVPPVIYFDFGLAKLSPDTSYGPITGEPNLLFPQVDMLFFGSQPFISPVLQKTGHLNLIDYMALITADLSSNEHQVLQDVFQDPYAISTVKLLQIAHQEHQKKGLEGNGFLVLTEKTHSAAMQEPEMAKLLHFPHLPDLNIRKLLAFGGGQWEAAGEILKREPHSVAYMTPGLVSSINRSYQGIGSLVLGQQATEALISDSLRWMHGGYGSPLPPNFLTHSNLSKPLDQPLPFRKPSADVRPGHKFESNSVSNPVDVVTGAFYLDEVDLSLPGPFPLQIRRNYSNQHPNPGPFGYGWKLGLNPFLQEEKDNVDGDKLFAAEMDGTVIVYRLNGDRYQVFPEDNPELRNFGGTANPFHAYIKDNILYGSDGSKRVFENGLLKKWIDPVGNTLTFDYEGQQLIQIENSTAHFVRFHYNGEGKISEAFTQDGRWVKYHYTYQGDLDQVTLPNGALFAYTYDKDHNILRKSAPHGRTLENRYDEKGRVVEQRSAVGVQQQLVTSATFQFQDGMTTVIDGEGGTTGYLIHDKQIYKITDPVGQTTYHSWFIDENSYFDGIEGQVTPWEGPGDYPHSLKTTQDKRGLLTEYRYDIKGNPILICLSGEDLTGNGERQIDKQLKYNELNLCIEESTLNRTTRTFYHHFLCKKVEKWVQDRLISTTDLSYDDQGQLTAQNCDGAVTRWVYQDGLPVKRVQETGTEDPDVVTTFQYNRQGCCIQKGSSDGTETHEYDIMGNTLATSLYDRSGQLLSSTLFGYNLNNQLIYKQGPDPLNTLSIDYNGAGQVKATCQSLTDGFAYRLFEYDTRGELIEEVNPFGVTTRRNLDPIGRPTSVTLGGITTHTTYEPGGLVASTVSPLGAKTVRHYTTNGLLKKEVYPDGTESSYEYDFFGRLTKETRGGTVTDIFYNDLDQKVVRTTAGIAVTEVYNPHGLQIATTDGEGYTWKKTYDGLGRLKTATSPDGQQTRWNYNGDTITCHYPSGETTVQQFACGQLIKNQTYHLDGSLIASTQTIYDPQMHFKQETSGSQTTTTWFNTLEQPLKVQKGPITTLYHYDPCGRCVETVDGEGYRTQFQFDDLDRLIKKTLPDGACIQFSYDADSHLISCDLPGDLTWKCSYDLMGRKTSEYLQSGQERSQQWTYAYEKGLLQRAIDPMGRTHAYFYDALSRLEKETVDRFTRLYRYDKRGHLLSAEDDGSKVLRSYDGCGRLISESIVLNGTVIQHADQSWSPNHRCLSVNGHERDFFYEAGHLKRVSTQGHTLIYDYDIGGNLVHKTTPYTTVEIDYNGSLPETITTHLKGETHKESLKWSPSGKLSSHNNTHFSYTPRGFLKAAGDERFSFDHNKPGPGIRTAANHALILQEGVDPFGKIITELIDSTLIQTTYDLLGQTTSIGSASFEWDVWGRLTQVTHPNATWKASYDPFGRRLKTTYSSGWALFPNETLFFYDPEQPFEEMGTKSGSTPFWKILGPNGCELIVDSSGHSIGLLQDAFGNLIATLTSNDIHWIKGLPSSYGPLKTAPIPLSLLTYAQSLTWQGKGQDPTGLILLGVRYYDPRSGRFLSQDPIGYPHSLNPYSYANGDPINFRPLYSGSIEFAKQKL